MSDKKCLSPWHLWYIALIKLHSNKDFDNTMFLYFVHCILFLHVDWIKMILIRTFTIVLVNQDTLWRTFHGRHLHAMGASMKHQICLFWTQELYFLPISMHSKYNLSYVLPHAHILWPYIFIRIKKNILFFDGFGLTDFHLDLKMTLIWPWTWVWGQIVFEIQMHTKACLYTILTRGHLLQAFVYGIF